ncbi:MAG: hypothetical protein CM1200mP28_15390 [Deltaproteobacteria bacterium]|nr:MAG: hypothetical protein CM1200mP28_15390 [Deltaproteobacteria bacterium]
MKRVSFYSSENRASVWKSPKEVIELIEDKNAYDLVVGFVQQTRAGRFVDPVMSPRIHRRDFLGYRLLEQIEKVQKEQEPGK